MNSKFKRTLLICHGGKGGVGKSYDAMVKAEYLLAAGAPVLLVEADPTQPDVATRYAGDPGVTVGTLSLNRAGDAENALAAFGQALEATAADQVIVNLPAGAGETLDAVSDMLRDLSNALDYRMVVTYALEKNRVAADELARSFAKGLLAHVDPENRFIVYPEYKGRPETFEWVQHPARDEFGAQEIVMPAIGSRSALKRLESTPGRIAGLIDKEHRPSGWMILDQSSIYRWYRSAVEAFAPIFAGSHIHD